MQLKTCLVYKFVFLLFNIRYSSLEQTNKLDCADENCTVPIGEGKAQVMIHPHMEGYLTMKAGEEGKIFGVFGKDLFLIETDRDKRRGFVSQHLFREMRLKKTGLIKSNVTAVQKPRLKEMNTNAKKEKGPVIQEENMEAKVVSNESEVPEVKQVVQGKTPAGQVVFEKEETPSSQLELQENDVTEEEEGDDEEEDENTASEIDDEDETEEATESTEEPSFMSKVANFLVGGDVTDEVNEEEPETIAEKNDTETLPDSPVKQENVVQNDTKQEPLAKDLPIDTENSVPETPVSEKSTKEEQSDDIKVENIIEMTTPLPEIVEIGIPPVQEVVVTTPTPPTKVEEEKPVEVETPIDTNNFTNPNTNDTEKDLGTPEFKPIPTNVPLTNTTEEQTVPEVVKPDEIKVPGTANVISTPPPLLGLMKSQIPKEAEKKVPVPEVKEADVKVEEVEKKVLVPEVKEADVKVEETEKVVEEVKPPVIPEEINEMIADETVKPVESEPVSTEKNTEEASDTEKSVEEPSELEKVRERLGAAPEELVIPSTKSEEETKDKKSEEVKSEETTKEEEKAIETPEKQETTQDVKVETPPTANSLGIDTYGNPAPPMKPIEEVPTDETVKIDNKLDLNEESTQENVPITPVETSADIPPAVETQPEQVPVVTEPEVKETEEPKQNKDQNKDFHQKREAIKNMLESEVPKHGSEIDSSEVKKPELPSKIKQGIPSIVEIRRNGKIITPKEVPVVAEDPIKPDPNPHSGEYCEASGGSCPADSDTISHLANMFGLDILLQDGFLQTFADKTIEMFDLIIYLTITATAVIFFLLMHSCVKRCMRESPLLEKINHLERSLMTSVKENATLKNDLSEAKGKLHKIEDTSFGSNEMVIALRKDLDDSEHIRHQLQQQVNILEQELQKSAAAGTELNKMLSDLLNSQTGSESILQSVEQLQKQLDEQQLTIESMTEALSSKSRENSELQVQLSEISSKLGLEIKSLKARNDDVELEKVCIENELKNLKKTFDEKIDAIERTKLEEIERIKQKLARKEKEALELHQKYRTSEAKIQALNECINDSKNGGDAADYLDSIDAKAELILITKERDTLKEELNAEINSKKSMESYVKNVGEEIDSLKKEFSVAEKEKLEAQTRLDVLSSYFRQKESELQRELSIKEALWMQQQGETTTTVERVKAMQEEIQQLKSQNDSLKAEILAQDTAYKAQTVALENKAHEAWLTARQSERKVEELRQESTILRRRLTSIAELQPGSANNSINNTSTNLVDGASGMPSLPSLNSVPSPLRVESPNSPLMLPGMPPPPQFLPGQFMPPGPLPAGLPPGVPPLPFIPPPPFDLQARAHGRLISPPPRGYSPSLIDDRYSPDSRYHDDYSVMSTRYDTETDFSPPPSPPKHSRNISSGGGYSRQNGANKAYSPHTSPQMNGRHTNNNNNNNSNRNKSNKGGFNSSGSQDSIIGSGSRKGHGKKI